ncbi:MAG: undecaprenyl diphosphate synthase family protein [Candidatus Woesearchaeota archaeon]
MPASLPKHVAFTADSSFGLVKSFAQQVFDLQIPVASFLLLSTSEPADFSATIDSLCQFFTDIAGWDYLPKNQVKVSVLGRWYDLPGRVVDRIKGAVEETKDYDKFFLNLCVNYDGQDEIVAACQLIAMQVKSEKLDPLAITKELVKENLYCSYFIPPDLIVKTGARLLPNLLLWDSPKAVIFFPGKEWLLLKPADFEDALKYYQQAY